MRNSKERSILGDPGNELTETHSDGEKAFSSEWNKEIMRVTSWAWGNRQTAGHAEGNDHRVSLRRDQCRESKLGKEIKIIWLMVSAAEPAGLLRGVSGRQDLSL